MKTKVNIKKRLIVWGLLVMGILSLPLIFKAPWTLGDFILAAVVLYGAAAGYEIASYKNGSRSGRIIIAIGAIGGVILFWAWAVA
jgi:hypothetical protein